MQKREPVKLSQVIKRLSEIRRLHGDLIVCSASDEEGNSFGESFYLPSVGKLEDGEFESPVDKPTHVCLN